MNGKTKIVNLFNTLFVLTLRSNLISASKTTDNGCKVLLKLNQAKVQKKIDVLLEAKNINGVLT